jgi:hypothetical protein
MIFGQMIGGPRAGKGYRDWRGRPQPYNKERRGRSSRASAEPGIHLPTNRAALGSTLLGVDQQHQDPWARRMVALLLHKPLVLLWVSGGPRITKVFPREIQWNHHYKYKLFKVDKYQLNRQEYKQDVKNYKFIFTLPNFIS